MTKLQAARRQLVTAIRLFFDDREPVSVHTLAHASWEILSCLCRADGIHPFAEKTSIILEQDARQIRRMASRYKNFFKHADRDPGEALDDFGDLENDWVLFAAASDLKSLCDDKVPIEVMVFFIWYLNINFPKELRNAELPNQAMQYWLYLGAKYLGDSRQQSRAELKRRGRDMLGAWLQMPEVINLPHTDRTQIQFWSD
ncbi:MAG: hypothetical protein FJX44_10845 [Alphaproteobacteria bacterium]|nr:hypothetical protein [Alphaproteobacteria bacterium]